jgi:outer membrane protein W
LVLDERGCHAGLEYKHKFLESNRLSLGISALYSQFDVKANGQKIGTIDNVPILLDLNWHFLEKRGLYIGVTVNPVIANIGFAYRW